MNIGEAVCHMTVNANMSKSKLSEAIGRNQNFINSSQHKRAWNPTLATLVAMARVCGYEVVLEGHDERLVLDSPHGEQTN